MELRMDGEMTMPDREKVINGLCDTIGIIHGYIPKRYWGYAEQACRDALALLKEQETIFLKDGHHVCCMCCGEYWCDSDREGNPFPRNFCPNCGRSVK